MEVVPMDIGNSFLETTTTTTGHEPQREDVNERMVVSMEVDANTLQAFLSSKSFVSTLNEGFFAVLMNDLRKEIWAHISDDKTFAFAMRVNHRWRQELEVAWKESCRRRLFIDAFWLDKGKDWKWMLKCNMVVFTENAIKNSPGTYEEKMDHIWEIGKTISKMDGEEKSLLIRAYIWVNGETT